MCVCVCVCVYIYIYIYIYICIYIYIYTYIHIYIYASATEHLPPSLHALRLRGGREGGRRGDDHIFIYLYVYIVCIYNICIYICISLPEHVSFLCRRYDYEGVEKAGAEAMMAAMVAAQPSLVGTTVDGMTIAKADMFECVRFNVCIVYIVYI